MQKLSEIEKRMLKNLLFNVPEVVSKQPPPDTIGTWKILIAMLHSLKLENP